MDPNFRIATYQDLRGIQELSKDVYGCTDTLVSDFVNWLERDKWFQFVGETEQGAVIAFIAIHVTDGKESLNIRSSRVSEDYRGRGIYKALFSYAVKYVRERLSDVKRIYRLRSVQIRVPDGYNIIKKRGLIKMFLNCDVKVDNKEADVDQCKVEFITWPKFKELYENNDTVKQLFVGNTMEIHCNAFRLDCEANWTGLEKRVNVCPMTSKCVGRDGKPESVISFLTLEKSFTNKEKIPMIPMNIYGLNKEAVKSHIVTGVLKATEYVIDQRVLLVFWMEGEIMAECANTLKAVYGRDLECQQELNLLLGGSNRDLGAI